MCRAELPVFIRSKTGLFIGSALAFAMAPLVGAQTVSTSFSTPVAAAAQRLALEHQAANVYWLAPNVTSPLEPLVQFRGSDIKFSLQKLMNTLRDPRHEGWVLAAYPDPKTSRPLIGAGLSLDLDAREHLQRDPLNPTPFLEPSSAQLWQAAGLDPQQLQEMLDQYDRDLAAWNKKKFRRKIRSHELFPQISEDDANKLLRIYAVQAVHNARAYCRNFDQLTGPQQMALSHLVFQMGVNLEQFTQFLGAINTPIPASTEIPGAGEQYWTNVQDALIHSDWARRYSTRAISVIAMFDPAYETDPFGAEARVRAEVHPLVYHSHKKRRATTVRTASLSHKRASGNRSRKS
jgi:hypothetical protein